jgi:hypothetical protein
MRKETVKSDSSSITTYEQYEKVYFPKRTKKKDLLVNEPMNFGANLAKQSIEMIKRELDKKFKSS